MKIFQNYWKLQTKRYKIVPKTKINVTIANSYKRMILRKKFGGIQEMYNIVSKLLIYGDMDEESILMQLSDIFRCMDEGSQTKDVLRTRVFKQVKRILEVATDYAFDKNLWHNYLTYLLITNENPFSITCEKVGASEGSVNHFAKSDFKAFKELFDFDFSRIED